MNKKNVHWLVVTSLLHDCVDHHFVDRFLFVCENRPLHF